MSVRDRVEGRHFQAPAPVAPAPTTSVRDILTSDGLQTIEQDPSMPDRPTVAVPTAPVGPTPAVPVAAAPAPAPVVEAPVVVAPTTVEQRYEWQPRDEQGRPLGGIQVYVYQAPAPLPLEILQQVTKGHEMAIRQLRKERKERAIGVEEKVDDAEKFSGVVEFKPRDLSADERFKIAQDLVNPEKFSDARDALVESAFGQKPAVLASTLNDVQRMMIRSKAVENYIDFVNASGFEDSPENRELVTGWLGTRNLAPTVANFVIAQKRLTEAGLLPSAPAVQQVIEPVVAPTPAVAAPVVTEESKPQTPAAPATRIGSAEQPQATRHSHVPSGLTPNVASAAGDLSPVSGSSLTLADVDKMPSDEYKKRMKDPAFVKRVNELENEAAARRRAKALGQ